MKDPNVNEYSMDPLLEEELNRALEEVLAAQGLRASPQAEPVRAEQLHPLGAPDPPTAISQPAAATYLVSARTKEVPLHLSTGDILTALSSQLGKVIFIPVPPGKARPTLDGWQDLTFEDTQNEKFQEMLFKAAQQGNLGILVGPESGRLLTVNITDKQVIEELIRDLPWLADTTRSWTQHRCQFWIRLEEGCRYPAGVVPLRREGRKCGELRLNREQSIIHGVDPSGARYERNAKAPVEIDLSDLYDVISWGTETEAARIAIEDALFPVIAKELDVNILLGSLEDEEPLPPFPLDLLPPIFRAPIEEVMRHYRVPALIPASCALTINSAAVGRGVAVKSNVRATYANLYCIIGAKSGTGKTVVFDEFMAPLEQLQHEMLDAFKSEEKPRTEAELILVKAEIQRLAKFKSNQKEPDSADDSRQERLGELLQRQAELEDKLQTAARLWCVDFTSEALGVLLTNSDEQTAVLSDEGGLALHNMLGRYTKGVVTDDILLCKAKSVNGTTVDRIGRAPIILRQPCVTLLLLVQPDLLRMAFSHERLLVGGFLARCLAADSRIKILYEDETTLPEVDPVVMQGWNDHIRALVKTFRFAEKPYRTEVEEGVRALSRKFHNDIVDQIRSGLSDVDSFALRWVERAWEIALNLHVGLYGIECHRHPLSKETFDHAILISRYFADRQLEVLNAMRIKASNDSRDRLKEILETNDNKPVTMRDLKRRHGLDRQEVLNTVNDHPECFGIAELRRQSGGTRSLVAFLKSNPPPKMQAKQV